MQLNRVIPEARTLLKEGNTSEIIKQLAEFPHAYDQTTGACSKLGPDNKCTIYEDRPDICNRQKMYKFFRLSIKQYQDISLRACQELQIASGLEPIE